MSMLTHINVSAKLKKKLDNAARLFKTTCENLPESAEHLFNHHVLSAALPTASKKDSSAIKETMAHSEKHIAEAIEKDPGSKSLIETALGLLSNAPKLTKPKLTKSSR